MTPVNDIRQAGKEGKLGERLLVVITDTNNGKAYRLPEETDFRGFQQALERTKVSPLGAGAQAGTALAINPISTAAALGMPHVFKNSIDAVTDRDFALAQEIEKLALVRPGPPLGGNPNKFVKREK